jgi:Family of unknown function (DUF6982)
MEDTQPRGVDTQSSRGVGDDRPDGTQFPDSPRRYKVVVNSGSGDVLNGYLETTEDLESAAFFARPAGTKVVFAVKVAGAEVSKEIALSDIKSLFIVKSFKGDSTRRDLRFYANGPDLGSVWVEVQFKDNEIVEGLVENSVEHLIGEGLLLRPSDPGSNNLLIYVNKAAIAGYRVLGVRSTAH